MLSSAGAMTSGQAKIYSNSAAAAVAAALENNFENIKVVTHTRDRDKRRRHNFFVYLEFVLFRLPMCLNKTVGGGRETR